MVCTDHWPAALLGAAGHPVIQTPCLNEIAGAGVRFTNCYSECPVCIPARRTLMTGTAPSTHGDRVFKATAPMPDLPTMPQCFRDAGYQAYAVGKLHVYPQRDRIGFDDVILAEEGRYQFGAIDDYQIWLGDQGFAGEEYTHGMCNNQYATRPWHLPEHTHVTNWATREMSRMIRRRDPGRPGFFYLSYCHPHPPLTPLQTYWDMYSDDEIDMPWAGGWSETDTHAIAARRGVGYSEHMIRRARRAFYAHCTQIDHQLRVVIGTLREEGMLNDTIFVFTSDHGDMLGNHNMWAKRLFYESSANVPLIVSGPGVTLPAGSVDSRIVGWQDIMPTVLAAAGLDVPDSCDGQAIFDSAPRPYLFGECSEGLAATRMIRKNAYKLIYYPCGNVAQLFNVDDDPRELHDLAGDPARADVVAELSALLMAELNNGDEAWAAGGALVGLPEPPPAEPRPARLSGLGGQRGIHWPPPGNPD
jgi:arylsulfatase A-like enzyme